MKKKKRVTRANQFSMHFARTEMFSPSKRCDGDKKERKKKRDDRKLHGNEQKLESRAQV